MFSMLLGGCEIFSIQMFLCNNSACVGGLVISNEIFPFDKVHCNLISNIPFMVGGTVGPGFVVVAAVVVGPV